MQLWRCSVLVPRGLDEANDGCIVSIVAIIADIESTSQHDQVKCP